MNIPNAAMSQPFSEQTFQRHIFGSKSNDNHHPQPNPLNNPFPQPQMPQNGFQNGFKNTFPLNGGLPQINNNGLGTTNNGFEQTDFAFEQTDFEGQSTNQNMMGNQQPIGHSDPLFMKQKLKQQRKNRPFEKPIKNGQALSLRLRGLKYNREQAVPNSMLYVIRNNQNEVTVKPANGEIFTVKPVNNVINLIRFTQGSYSIEFNGYSGSPIHIAQPKQNAKHYQTYTYTSNNNN